MKRQASPPIKTPMYDAKGNMAHVWAKWFEQIGHNSDDYKRAPDKVFTTNATLTTDDYGKTLVFDTSASLLTCTLMTPNARDVYGWFTIFRRGVNGLYLAPDATSRIEYGSLGGRIWNTEAKRYAANVTLQLLTVTQWGIVGATGLWYVR